MNLKKILFLILFFTNLYSEDTYIAVNGNEAKKVSTASFNKIKYGLDSKRIPYKILKDEYDNFLIEVSSSSFATGKEFGSFFREAVGYSYDNGYSFGKWLRHQYELYN